MSDRRLLALLAECRSWVDECKKYRLDASALLARLRAVDADARKEATAAERERCEMAVRTCLDESQRQSVAMQLVVVKAVAAIRQEPEAKPCQRCNGSGAVENSMKGIPLADRVCPRCNAKNCRIVTGQTA